MDESVAAFPIMILILLVVALVLFFMIPLVVDCDRTGSRLTIQHPARANV